MVGGPKTRFRQAPRTGGGLVPGPFAPRHGMGPGFPPDFAGGRRLAGGWGRNPQFFGASRWDHVPRPNALARGGGGFVVRWGGGGGPGGPGVGGAPGNVLWGAVLPVSPPIFPGVFDRGWVLCCFFFRVICGGGAVRIAGGLAPSNFFPMKIGLGSPPDRRSVFQNRRKKQRGGEGGGGGGEKTLK